MCFFQPLPWLDGQWPCPVIAGDTGLWGVRPIPANVA